jgi:hypothetical protein
MKINIIRSLVRWYLKGKSLSRAKIEMKDVSNILVMSNTAIGDTLFATPAINLLRKNYPDKNIIALIVIVKNLSAPKRAVAAGITRKAAINTIPTSLIDKTMVSAIITESK